MPPKLTLIAFICPDNIPILDTEYDLLEPSSDLENNYREAERAIFYHDTLDAA